MQQVSEIRKLYNEAKELLMKFPEKEPWSKCFESFDEIPLQSEDACGVLNQLRILQESQIIPFGPCNIDEHITTHLDYDSSNKKALIHKHHRQTKRLISNTTSIKHVLQRLIHTLQHTNTPSISSISNANACRWLRISKLVGNEANEGQKFSDRDSLASENRRLIQIQVCYDKAVHGIQVKWLCEDGRILSGSQHFSSRFSGKNIEAFVLGTNEYINHVSGRFTQTIDSLHIRTNFGRSKTFGTNMIDNGNNNNNNNGNNANNDNNNGIAFDLEIPLDCQVIGFSGSYSSSLYTLAALYRKVKTNDCRMLVSCIDDRLAKIRMVNNKIESILFNELKNHDCADVHLLSLMRSNKQRAFKKDKKSNKYKSENIKNQFIMKTLMLLVKSCSKHDPNVIPEILNILASLLEDGNLDIFASTSTVMSPDDPYEDLMEFMKTIAMDTPSLSLTLGSATAIAPQTSTNLANVHVQTQANIPGQTVPTRGTATNPLSSHYGLSQFHQQGVDYHNQCLRVMIAAAIKRGNLADMLGIVRMLLYHELSHERRYCMGKILHKLHDYVASLREACMPSLDDSDYCPIKSIKLYAPMLDETRDSNNNGENRQSKMKKHKKGNNNSSDSIGLMNDFDLNYENVSISESYENKKNENSFDNSSEDEDDDGMLTGLQLAIVLLSELHLIAISKKQDASHIINESTIAEPLHIDFSSKVLGTLTEILFLASEFQKKAKENNSKNTKNKKENKEKKEEDGTYDRNDAIHASNVILSHSLHLLNTQLSTVDKLRISWKHLEYPKQLIIRLKSKILSIIRNEPSTLPHEIIRTACTLLVDGQKIFLPTVTAKLSYLLALLLRKQELLIESLNEKIEKSENNVKKKGKGVNMNNIVNITQNTYDKLSKLVTGCDSISEEEIELALPIMLSHFRQIHEPSQLIDCILSNEKQNNSNSNNNNHSGTNNDSTLGDNRESQRKLFFAILEILISICCVETQSCVKFEQLFDENEDILNLLLDLQSILIFRYQTWMQSPNSKQIYFDDSVPFSIQELWKNEESSHNNDTNKNSKNNKNNKNNQNNQNNDSNEESDIVDQSFFAYINHILSISCDILSDFEDCQIQFFFSDASGILHKCFYGKIVISLITTMLSLVERCSVDTKHSQLFKAKMHQKMLTNLLPSLSLLLKRVDNILYHCFEYSKTLKPRYETIEEIRESKHPYSRGEVTQKLVTIPGAKQLKVKFDKNVCHTISDLDFLQLFTKTENGFVRASSAIHGASSKWPDYIVIPGDCVLIHFKSDEASVLDSNVNNPIAAQYGYKVTIEGSVKMNEMNQVRWLEDLSTLLVRFHNTIASNFIDPGNLNVSFQLLKQYPLLFVGGYHPLLLNSIAQAQETQVFRRQSQTETNNSNKTSEMKKENQVENDIAINLKTPSRRRNKKSSSSNNSGNNIRNHGKLELPDTPLVIEETPKQSIAESPSYDVEFKNDCMYIPKIDLWVRVNHEKSHFNTKELSDLVNKVYYFTKRHSNDTPSVTETSVIDENGSKNNNDNSETSSMNASSFDISIGGASVNNLNRRYEQAFKTIMQDLFSHTRRMSMHNLMKIPLLFESISQCHCAMFAVLLRHTGIVETFHKLLEKHSNVDYKSTSDNRRDRVGPSLPSELLLIWKRARSAIDVYFRHVTTEKEMKSAKRKILERTEFLLWLSPAHYDLREMLNDYKTSDLKEYPSAVLTPNVGMTSWICENCTHLNKYYLNVCQICDHTPKMPPSSIRSNSNNNNSSNNSNSNNNGTSNDAKNNFNCRFTWSEKDFPNKELFKSFCCLQHATDVFKSQQSTYYQQNEVELTSVNKLIRQIIDFVGEFDDTKKRKLRRKDERAYRFDHETKNSNENESSSSNVANNNSNELKDNGDSEDEDDDNANGNENEDEHEHDDQDDDIQIRYRRDNTNDNNNDSSNSTGNNNNDNGNNNSESRHGIALKMDQERCIIVNVDACKTLLKIQSSLSLFRIKGLQIIQEMMQNLKYHENIAYFAENLAKLLILPEMECDAPKPSIPVAELKHIEKKAKHITKSAVFGDGFTHVLANVEFSGYNLTNRILEIFHNVIELLYKGCRNIDMNNKSTIFKMPPRIRHGHHGDTNIITTTSHNVTLSDPPSSPFECDKNDITGNNNNNNNNNNSNNQNNDKKQAELSYLTPMLHLVACCIRSQDLSKISQLEIIQFLSHLFDWNNICMINKHNDISNMCDGDDNDKMHITSQHRFIAWSVFRSLAYAACFPMFSSIPTINSYSLKQQLRESVRKYVPSSSESPSPSGRCLGLLSLNTMSSRDMVLNQVVSVIIDQLDTLLNVQSECKKLTPLQDSLLMQEMFTQLYKRPEVQHLANMLHNGTSDDNNNNRNFRNGPLGRSGNGNGGIGNNSNNNNNNNNNSNNNNGNNNARSWVCHVCTFENVASDDKCAVCERGSRSDSELFSEKENDDIGMSWLCAYCGYNGNIATQLLCNQCNRYNEDEMQQNILFSSNGKSDELSKIVLLKWLERIQRSNVENADMLFSHCIQKDVGWTNTDDTNKGNNNNNNNNNNGVHPLASQLAMNQMLWLTLRCCASAHFRLIISESPKLIEILLKIAIGEEMVLYNLSSMSRILAIRVITWIFPEMSPFVATKSITSNVSDTISENSNNNNNNNQGPGFVTPKRSKSKSQSRRNSNKSSPMMSRKIGPTASNTIQVRKFIRYLFQHVGNIDLISFDTLTNSKFEKEKQKCRKNVTAELVHLLRVLCKHEQWIAQIEPVILQRLLHMSSSPVSPNETVDSDNKQQQKQQHTNNNNNNDNNGSNDKMHETKVVSPIKQQNTSITNAVNRIINRNDNDDEKHATPSSQAVNATARDISTMPAIDLSGSKGNSNNNNAVATSMGHENDDIYRTKSGKVVISANVHNISSSSSNNLRGVGGVGSGSGALLFDLNMANDVDVNGTGICLSQLCKQYVLKDDCSDDLNVTSQIDEMVGIFCVLGEFTFGLYEGARVKVIHKRLGAQVIGSVTSLKLPDTSDFSSSFEVLKVKADDGTQLDIDTNNQSQFRIQLLDYMQFDPTFFYQPKTLLHLLFKCLDSATLILPNWMKNGLLRRILAVIKTFTVHKEFAPIIEKLQSNLTKNLVKIALNNIIRFSDDDEICEYTRNIDPILKEIWRKNLRIGSVIDCQDKMGKWFESEILNFDHSRERIYVHYCEWSSKWDEWVDITSKRVQPWNSHTDGSFKNRGYKPLTSECEENAKIKRKNPLINVNKFKKYTLAMQQFNPGKRMNREEIIESIDTSNEENLKQNISMILPELPQLASTTSSVSPLRSDESSPVVTSGGVDASPRIHGKTLTGMPCPNHVFLPLNAPKSSLTEDIKATDIMEWNDMVSNEETFFVTSINNDKVNTNDNLSNDKDSVKTVKNNSNNTKSDGDKDKNDDNNNANENGGHGSDKFSINLSKQRMELSLKATKLLARAVRQHAQFGLTFYIAMNFGENINDRSYISSFLTLVFTQTENSNDNDNDNDEAASAMFEMHIGIKNGQFTINQSCSNIEIPFNDGPICLMVTIMKSQMMLYVGTTEFDSEYDAYFSRLLTNDSALLMRNDNELDIKFEYNSESSKNNSNNNNNDNKHSDNNGDILLSIEQMALWRWVGLTGNEFDQMRKYDTIPKLMKRINSFTIYETLFGENVSCSTLPPPSCNNSHKKSNKLAVTASTHTNDKIGKQEIKRDDFESKEHTVEPTHNDTARKNNNNNNNNNRGNNNDGSDVHTLQGRPCYASIKLNDQDKACTKYTLSLSFEILDVNGIDSSQCLMLIPDKLTQSRLNRFADCQTNGENDRSSNNNGQNDNMSLSKTAHNSPLPLTKLAKKKQFQQNEVHTTTSTGATLAATASKVSVSPLRQSVQAFARPDLGVLWLDNDLNVWIGDVNSETSLNDFDTMDQAETIDKNRFFVAVSVNLDTKQLLVILNQNIIFDREIPKRHENAWHLTNEIIVGQHPCFNDDNCKNDNNNNSNNPNNGKNILLEYVSLRPVWYNKSEILESLRPCMFHGNELIFDYLEELGFENNEMSLLNPMLVSKNKKNKQASINDCINKEEKKSEENENEQSETKDLRLKQFELFNESFTNAITNKKNENDNNKNSKNNSTKQDLLATSHCLYFYLKQTSTRQSAKYAQKLSCFTGWNVNECEKMLAITNSTEKRPKWDEMMNYVLCNKMNERKMNVKHSDIHTNNNQNNSNNKNVNNGGNGFPHTYYERDLECLMDHMKSQFDYYMCENLNNKDKKNMNISWKYGDTSVVVFDHCDAIHQDIVNDRFRFFSKQELANFTHIGSYDEISQRLFCQLQSIIESNLSSLYARQIILSLFDEMACFNDNLANLLPSLKLSQCLLSNDSDNTKFDFDKIFVRLLEILFEEESASKVVKLSKAIESEIIDEIENVAQYNKIELRKDCPMIFALMKYVIYSLLKYTMASYREPSDQLDGMATPEFAWWIVSIFVNALYHKNINNGKKKRNNMKEKLLVLLFNDTLIYLLWECIILAPTRCSYKIALMMAKIVEFFPKKSKLLQFKKTILHLRDEMHKIWMESFPNRTQNRYGNGNGNNIVGKNSSNEMCLHINEEHILIVSRMVTQMYTKHFSSQECSFYVLPDVFTGLVQLMVSIFACNYHENLELHLAEQSWFESLLTVRGALKWLSLNDGNEMSNKNQNNRNDRSSSLSSSLSSSHSNDENDSKRNRNENSNMDRNDNGDGFEESEEREQSAEYLQIIAPKFYNELVEHLSKWKSIDSMVNNEEKNDYYNHGLVNPTKLNCKMDKLQSCLQNLTQVIIENNNNINRNTSGMYNHNSSNKQRHDNRNNNSNHSNNNSNNNNIGSSGSMSSNNNNNNGCNIESLDCNIETLCDIARYLDIYDDSNSFDEIDCLMSSLVDEYKESKNEKEYKYLSNNNSLSLTRVKQFAMKFYQCLQYLSNILFADSKNHIVDRYISKLFDEKTFDNSTTNNKNGTSSNNNNSSDNNSSNMTNINYEIGCIISRFMSDQRQLQRHFGRNIMPLRQARRSRINNNSNNNNNSNSVSSDNSESIGLSQSGVQSAQIGTIASELARGIPSQSEHIIPRLRGRRRVHALTRRRNGIVNNSSQNNGNNNENNGASMPALVADIADNNENNNNNNSNNNSNNNNGNEDESESIANDENSERSQSNQRQQRIRASHSRSQRDIERERERERERESERQRRHSSNNNVSGNNNNNPNSNGDNNNSNSNNNNNNNNSNNINGANNQLNMLQPINVDLKDISFENYDIEDDIAVWYNLSHMNPISLKIRMQMILQLNRLLSNSQIIALADISSLHETSDDYTDYYNNNVNEDGTQQSSNNNNNNNNISSNFDSLANLLCKMKNVILPNLSTMYFDYFLNITRDGHTTEPAFQIDRFRCRDNVNDSEYLMFTECMKQLDSYKADIFRLDSHHKAWKTVFINEHSVDAGGPYRESIEWMCNEIQEPERSGLSLFMICPNGRDDTGKNRDKFVPNPRCCDLKYQQMYQFLGKLMGLAIRTKELLPLNFAPLVWKRIMNEKLTIKDIYSIDQNAFAIFDHLSDFINIVRKYENRLNNNSNNNSNNNNNDNGKENREFLEMKAQIGMFNNMMQQINSKFVARSSDGEIYSLIPNGEFLQITHLNLLSYEMAHMQFKLEEYDFACEAMRRGLATVIPIHSLNLLTWEQFEHLVCGEPRMNINLLQEMTIYSNCNVNDRHISLFWEMVKHKFNESERSKLLTFCWGRSRLPTRKEDFDKKFTIVKLESNSSNPDALLPVAHTCFFQLDLPTYSSLNVMYSKVSYAISHCCSIDTDE